MASSTIINISMENVWWILQNAINLFHCHPFSVLLILFSIFFICKIIFTNEIIVNYKEEVPREVRIMLGQTLPPFYPNGWIPIFLSDRIKKNQVKSVLCCGKELIVARGPSGQVYVLDAYCPHLGANLAVGGSVGKVASCNEDCIRCPFHSWSFRMSDGQCVDVPYENNPPNAKLKVWESIEMNNVIFVWHHADDEKPEWFPKKVEQISDHKWVAQGSTVHFVNCHFQEIPENGADVIHLNEIHKSSIYLGCDIDSASKDRWYKNILQHEWLAEWNPCLAPNQHMSSLQVTNINKLFGWKLFEVKLDINQIGPAYVELRFKSNFCGGIEGIILQLVKPIGPFRNSITHVFYTKNSIVGYIFSKFLLFSEAKMLERDIRIWNRKAFLSKPYFAKTERSLVKYRRWFNQFYSSGSSKITYNEQW